MGNIKAKISTKKELIIEAIQTENGKDDVGCFEICSYRGMTEVLQIPDHINADDIDVSLLKSGDLLITVPRSSVVKKDQIKGISGPEVEKTLEIRMNDRSCQASKNGIKCLKISFFQLSSPTLVMIIVRMKV